MSELLTTEEAADLSAALRTQALRARRQWRGPLHQGDRPLAVSQKRARSLGYGGPRRLGGAADAGRSSAAATIRCWNGRCARAAPALATLPEGSEAGLRRLSRGEVMAAAIHLHRLEGNDESANIDAVAHAPGLHDAVVVGFARREQGLLVAARQSAEAFGHRVGRGRQGPHRACGPPEPARNCCCWRCWPRPTCRWQRFTPASRPARPAPTSRRRSARSAPIAASRPARSRARPASISCL